MNRCFFFLVVLILISIHAAAQDTYILAAALLDVETGKIIPNPVVHVRSGKIVAVDSIGHAKLPNDADVIDLPELTLLPGLIDAHVHLAWAPAKEQELPGKEEAMATLQAGFTTVRNLGSTGWTDLALRNAIEKGEIPGPRMLIAGPALGSKGGICDQVFAGEAVVTSPDEARKQVQASIAKGVDVIKFCAGGQVIPTKEDLTTTELSPEIMRAIVEEAHKHNRKVAAHAQGPAAIRSAVKADVDSIEHGGLIDEATALLLKEQNIPLVPTVYRLTWRLQNAEKNSTDPAKVAELRNNVELIRKNIGYAIQAGVSIVFGTDATVIPHGQNAHEFTALTALGLSPLQAIQSATVNAAILLGLEGKIGAIKPEMAADMIGVKGNPLQDIKLLQNVAFVMKDGHRIK